MKCIFKSAIGLVWYRTYGEFFSPMGDATFWSGGKSVEVMRKCVKSPPTLRK